VAQICVAGSVKKAPSGVKNSLLMRLELPPGAPISAINAVLTVASQLPPHLKYTGEHYEYCTI